MTPQSITVLRGAERIATPWKNGQGSTCEIVRHPPGQDFADFDWRVSHAHFERDSDFSQFAGVDRILVVLEGTVEILVEPRVAVRLDATSVPFEFPGDSSTHARVLQAPVADLNVMIKRGRARASVRRRAIAGHESIVLAGDPALLYVAAGSTTIRSGDFAADLAESDGVVVRSDAPVGLVASSSSAAVVLVSIEQL